MAIPTDQQPSIPGRPSQINRTVLIWSPIISIQQIGPMDVSFSTKARGYTVTDCFNQKTDNNSGGFTLANFKELKLTRAPGAPESGRAFHCGLRLQRLPPSISATPEITTRSHLYDDLLGWRLWWDEACNRSAWFTGAGPVTYTRYLPILWNPPQSLPESEL